MSRIGQLGVKTSIMFQGATIRACSFKAVHLQRSLGSQRKA
jgi:hypothetical protein